jgi:hypothetical protein
MLRLPNRGERNAHGGHCLRRQDAATDVRKGESMIEKEPISFGLRPDGAKNCYDDDFLKACGIASVGGGPHPECSFQLKMIRDRAKRRGLWIPQHLTVTRSTAKQFFTKSPDGPEGQYLLVDWALYFIESAEMSRAECVRGECADSAEGEFIRKLIDRQEGRAG